MPKKVQRQKRDFENTKRMNQLPTIIEEKELGKHKFHVIWVYFNIHNFIETLLSNSEINAYSIQENTELQLTPKIKTPNQFNIRHCILESTTKKMYAFNISTMSVEHQSQMMTTDTMYNTLERLTNVDLQKINLGLCINEYGPWPYRIIISPKIVDARITIHATTDIYWEGDPSNPIKTSERCTIPGAYVRVEGEEDPLIQKTYKFLKELDEK